jgi:hypothetical protein
MKFIQIICSVFFFCIGFINVTAQNIQVDSINIKPHYYFGVFDYHGFDLHSFVSINGTSCALDSFELNEKHDTLRINAYYSATNSVDTCIKVDSFSYCFKDSGTKYVWFNAITPTDTSSDSISVYVDRFTYVDSLKIAPTTPRIGQNINMVGYFRFGASPAYFDSVTKRFYNDSIVIHAYFSEGNAASISFRTDLILLEIIKKGIYNLTLFTHYQHENDSTYDFISFEVLESNSVENRNKLDFEIFPNPVKEVLTIKLSEESQHFSWKIRTIDGRLVSSGLNSKNLDYNIDVSELKSGHYFLEVIGESGSTTKGFVKE